MTWSSGPEHTAGSGTAQYNALLPPPRIWWRPLGRDERMWVTVALVWSLILFTMMWAWPAFGEQNTPIESYRVEPAEFKQATAEFIERYQVGEEYGVPVVEPPPGGEVFLEGMAFQFRPILRLKRGETYRIYASSTDFQHGLSLQPVNLNFQLLPGYVYVIHLTPAETGEFSLVCNEFCGPGHHVMTGRIVVVD